MTDANCTIKNSGASGICTDINDCQPILKDIRLGIRNYTLCHKQNGIGYICCPNPKNINKCQEYVEFMYKNETISRKRNCFTEALIIGGSNARAGEFPHMALIGTILSANKTNWLCGGALISEKYILTAAHCTFLKNFQGGQPIVRLGELTINNDDADEDPEDFNITKFIRHPEYNLPSRYNDIALIQLDRNVKFNKYKRPACLSTQINSNYEKVIATGWGVAKYGGPHSSTMQKVILEKFSYSDCYDFFKNVDKSIFEDGIKNSTQICYGSKSERKDTCKGVSGGPIQIRIQLYACMYEIIGITSTDARECGKPGYPSIYTRLYPYIPWIEQTIWN